MRLLTYIFVTLLLIITIKGALALSVDADDSVTAIAGEKISQSLILYDFGDSLDAVELSVIDVTGDSPSSWLSLSNSSNFSSIQVYQDSAFITYDIRIPDDTPVGIYRSAFVFSDGNDTATYNIKISVQGRFIAGITRFFDIRVLGSILVGHLVFASLTFFAIIYIVFQIIGYGGFYGKKKR